jgi:hypothetical protein
MIRQIVDGSVKVVSCRLHWPFGSGNKACKTGGKATGFSDERRSHMSQTTEQAVLPWGQRVDGLTKPLKEGDNTNFDELVQERIA